MTGPVPNLSASNGGVDLNALTTYLEELTDRLDNDNIDGGTAEPLDGEL